MKQSDFLSKVFEMKNVNDLLLCSDSPSSLPFVVSDIISRKRMGKLIHRVYIKGLWTHVFPLNFHPIDEEVSTKDREQTWQQPSLFYDTLPTLS